MKIPNGYFGILLDVNLSTGQIKRRDIDQKDLKHFIGGRGLGIKILWDSLKKPGIDPLSPQNPLLFLPGPFSGFPMPSASRTCVVTKSPITTPIKSRFKHASTLSYSNMGGFFGPEIRFAGYDGILIRGKSDKPVYLYIDGKQVEIRDARKFWGMGCDRFDRVFIKELGDRRFRTCYIGPAGENLSPIACILNTVARAAGRGGTGCVMGSKKLKAIAIRGNIQPDVAQHKKFLELLEKTRKASKGKTGTEGWRRYGTGAALIWASDAGRQAVKNYREGTFLDIDKIGGIAARRGIWQRDFACYVCPLACKKAGKTSRYPHPQLVHDGPEYETGTMLGANLLINEMNGMQRAIFEADDLGLDIIAAGNIIGFLMEAYEKKLINRSYLDGIDLKWGDAASTVKFLRKLAFRDGVGHEAGQGVKYLAEKIKSKSHRFAIHCKGHTYAAWNCHVRPTQGLCYATSNRGACHLNGHNPGSQNKRALQDSTGVCIFNSVSYPDHTTEEILEAITLRHWNPEDYTLAGERIFNLEKCFNYREGFRRADDTIPDRFFEEPLTVGPKKGAVLDKGKFKKIMDKYYRDRNWSVKTTRPSNKKLKDLGLDFVLDSLE